MITVKFQKLNIEYLESNYDELLRHLPASRQSYIQKFKKGQSAFVELGVSLLLYEIIKSKYGETGALYDIVKNEAGKPYIKELPEFYFNISHSGECVAVAYGDRCLGVDIQKIVTYREKVARKCFTETEKRYVEGKEQQYDKRQGSQSIDVAKVSEIANPSAIDYRFTHIWTIKEAYAKYTGRGLGEDFKTIHIDLVNEAIEYTTAKYTSKVFENYIISVCAENTSHINFENV